MARPVLLRILGDADDARGEIRRTREELKEFARETAEARLDVQTKAAEAQIENVRRRIENLANQEASPRVDIQMAAAVSKLERLEAKLAKLRATDVTVDVDVRRGNFERAAAGVTGLNRRVLGLGAAFSNVLRAVPLIGTTLGFALRGVLGLAANIGSLLGDVVTAGVSKLLSTFTSLSGPIGQAAGGIVSLGFSLLTMAATAGAAVIALNAIVGAAIALGSALVALVASLTAAIGGLGALAVAFGAVLGPAVLVVIGVFTRFAQILEARQAREKALEQAVYDQKAAEEQRTAALERVRDAEQRLADTTVDGRKAAAQAIEEQADAQRSLASAKLGVQEARLNLRDARAELRDFLRGAGAVGPTLNALTKKFSDINFDPSAAGQALGATTGKGVSGDRSRELQRLILGVRRAHLGVKDAVDQVGDSERALGDARQRNNEFVRAGLRAYRPYRDALEALHEANVKLADATDQTTRAQDEYERELAKLSGTEQGSLSRLNAFIDAFTRLAQSFSDPIFRALNDVFDDLRGNTGFLERGLREVGEAFGGIIRQFGRFLGEPATRRAFTEMASGAAHLTRELGGRAYISFLRIMREVARAALPAVRSGASRVADALSRIARQPAAIRRAVGGLIGHFRTWANLAWQVLRATVGVFRAAAGPGRSLAGNLTTIVRRFADWVNTEEGQRRLRAFFARMVSRAKEIVRQIGRIVHWLGENLPSAAAKAKAAFEDLRPILQTLVDILEEFSNLSGSTIGKLLMPVSPHGSSGGVKGLDPKTQKTPIKPSRPGGLQFNPPAKGSSVIRNSLGEQLGGIVGALAPAPAAAAPAGAAFHAHITVPGGGPPDPRSLAEKLERELRLG